MREWEWFKGNLRIRVGTRMHEVSRSRCTAGSNRADGAAVDSGKEKGNGGSSLSEGQRSKRENYKGSEIAR